MCCFKVDPREAFHAQVDVSPFLLGIQPFLQVAFAETHFYQLVAPLCKVGMLLPANAALLDGVLYRGESVRRLCRP